MITQLEALEAHQALFGIFDDNETAEAIEVAIDLENTQ